MRTIHFILGLFIFSCISGQIDIEWIARFNGMGDFNDNAEDIKVDKKGNVYVTGTSFQDNTTNGYNIVTIKYGPEGNEIWNAIWTSTGNHNDKGCSIDVDTNGNVYIAGETVFGDIVTIKYNENGEELWTQIYSDEGIWNHRYIQMQLTESNNVIVSSVQTYLTSFDNSIVFLKYDQDGSLLWNSSYGKDDKSTDYLRDFVVDEFENIYATGLTNYFFNPMSQDYDGGDVLILKLNGSVDIQWSSYYHSIDNDYETGRSICIDESQNIYITGRNKNKSYTYAKVITLSYDSNGNQKWIEFFEQSDTTKSQGEYISYGENQRIYILGWSTFYPHKTNMLNISYDVTGKLLWSKNYYAPTYETASSSSAIVVDYSGNVYSSGFSHGLGGRHDVNIIAYDQDGNNLFAETYNVLGTSSNKVIDMVLDENGSLYMAVDCSRDIFTLKFSNHTRIIPEEMMAQNSVTIFPNPLTSISTIYVENPENKEYDIVFFDISGKLHTQITTNEKSTDIYRKDFNPGLYIYKLKYRSAFGGGGKLIVM